MNIKNIVAAIILGLSSALVAMDQNPVPNATTEEGIEQNINFNDAIALPQPKTIPSLYRLAQIRVREYLLLADEANVVQAMKAIESLNVHQVWLQDVDFITRCAHKNIISILRVIPTQDLVNFAYHAVDALKCQAMVRNKKDVSERLLKALEEMIHPKELGEIEKYSQEMNTLIPHYNKLKSKMARYDMHNAELQRSCRMSGPNMRSLCLITDVYKNDSNFLSKIHGEPWIQAFGELLYQLPHKGGPLCECNRGSCLHGIAASGNVELFKWLIEHDKNNPFMVVDHKTGQSTERKKLDVNITDNQLLNCLHHAIGDGEKCKPLPSLAMVELLIGLSVNHLKKNSEGLTPLGRALLQTSKALEPSQAHAIEYRKIINYLLTLKKASKDRSAEKNLEECIEDAIEYKEPIAYLKDRYPLFVEYNPDFFDQYAEYMSGVYSDSSDEQGPASDSEYAEHAVLDDNSLDRYVEEEQWQAETYAHNTWVMNEDYGEYEQSQDEEDEDDNRDDPDLY